MRQLLSVLVALLLASLLAWPACADLRATVDRTEIAPDETLTLSVEYDGGDGEPDFSALQQDFAVRGSEQSSRLQITNGQISHSVSWQLALAPKHPGNLTIPALQIGNERTQAIRIKVAATVTAAQAGSSDAVRLLLSTTPAHPYVQAQLSVTLRQLTRIDAQTLGDLPQLPDIPGAVVQPLSAPLPTSERIGGQDYAVIEQRYAVFPQHSGPLVIPPVSVEAVTASAAGPRQRVLVSSTPLRVDVLPKSASYPNTAVWLPAQRLRLQEAWNVPATVRVGTPLVRAIQLQAEGLAASTLPDLPWHDSEALRLYADAPAIRESTDGAFITGTRTQGFTWVPTRPGHIQLPGLDLLWWDVGAGALRHAVLPPREIDVIGAALPSAPVAKSPHASPLQDRAARTAHANWRQIDPDIIFVLGALASAAFAAFVVVLGWRTLRAHRATRANTATTPDALAAKHWQTLERACSANNAVAAQRAITEWLATQRPAPPWRDDPRLRALRAAALRADPTWRGDALLAWLRDGGSTRARAPGELPPLYPDARKHAQSSDQSG